MRRRDRNSSGHRIREVRVLRRLTQSELAAQLTIMTGELEQIPDWAPSREMVERIENGDKVVSDQMLLALSLVLEVDPRWLIGHPAGIPPTRSPK